jgi:hypothetical protein
MPMVGIGKVSGIVDLPSAPLPGQPARHQIVDNWIENQADMRA